MAPTLKSWTNSAEFDMAASTEDPTPYTMELISREQLLGPRHPEVPPAPLRVPQLPFHTQISCYDSPSDWKLRQSDLCPLPRCHGFRYS
jgi:hypothetical protein